MKMTIFSEAYPSTIITFRIKGLKKLRISNEILGETSVSVASLIRESSSEQGASYSC